MVARVVSCLVAAACTSCGFDAPAADSGVLDAPALDATSDGPVTDAPLDAPLDAPPGTTHFESEAEDYQTNLPSPSSATTIASWTLDTAIAGASGTGSMLSGPGQGLSCTPATTIPTCSALLTYALPDVAAGAYYVHLRLYAPATSADSVWTGLDGIPNPMVIGVSTLNAWSWETIGPFSLSAGDHTLDVWQRETGTRVDRVAVTQSSGPP